jgi:hypothetical protein
MHQLKIPSHSPTYTRNVELNLFDNLLKPGTPPHLNSVVLDQTL